MTAFKTRPGRPAAREATRAGRTKAVVVLAGSLLVLTTGLTRLADYTVPMWQGRYEVASQSKYEECFEPEETGPPGANIFEEPSLFQRSVENGLACWLSYTDTVVGDRFAARFDRALVLYRDHDYDSAIRAFNRAYSTLCDSEGKLPRAKALRAAEIQLLVGNCYANQGKTSEAVSAYQLSLTFDPDNRITIYNLERLLSSGGGGGKDGDKPKPLNPGQVNEKI